MLLAIDIGNTLIDFGLFKGDDLLAVYKAATKPIRSEDEYKNVFENAFKSANVSKKDIEEIIISCVVPSLTQPFIRLAKAILGRAPLLVGPGLSSGLLLRVDNPLEVGSDLVADAIGGKSLYGKNLFICDLGTASKYLYLDNDGAFAGLAIAPGFRLSIEALVEGAASLPEVTLIPPKNVMGKNTLDCMNSGITYGSAYEAKGFFEAFQKEANRPLKAILTGGNAHYISSLLPEFSFEPNLLLIGLKEIAKRRHHK